jgi:hypothetical protein
MALLLLPPSFAVRLFGVADLVSRRILAVKHIARISKHPALAAPWQDFVCAISQVVADLLSTKGGSVPLVTYLDTKCQPNPNLES